MKNESEYTADVTRQLRLDLPNHLVFKYADRFTKGIPDFSVSDFTSRVTIWVECKRIYKLREVINCPITWIDKAEAMQMQNIVRLRGHYLVFDPIHSQWAFLQAGLVAYHFRERSIIRPEHLVDGMDFIVNHPHFWELYPKMLHYLTKELSS